MTLTNSRPHHRREAHRRRRRHGVSPTRVPTSPSTTTARATKPTAGGRAARAADDGRTCSRPISRFRTSAGGSSTRSPPCWRRLDILVNMASIYASEAPRRARPTPTGIARCRSTCAPPGLVLARGHPPPARRGGGRIVNFTDWVGAQRAPAVHRLRALLRRQGGRARADRGAGARTGQGPDPRQRHRARTDRGAAWARPTRTRAKWSARRRSGAGAARSEIVKAVLVLVESDFITGECIRVDGGRHLK